MSRKSRKQMEEILGTMLSTMLDQYEKQPSVGLPAAVIVGVVWVPEEGGVASTTVHMTKHQATQLTNDQVMALMRGAFAPPKAPQ